MTNKPTNLGKFDQSYWEQRWRQHQTGWDIGYPSPPITEYFDQVADQQAHILIPGCGAGYEGEYLYNQGFSNVFQLDLAPTSLKQFAKRVPAFPESQLLCEDYFEHEAQYDYIVEQTFFCALDPALRADYIAKTHALLKPGGKLVGLLFETDFGKDHPPFGGRREEYTEQFSAHFDVHTFETAHNSIKPRMGRELFMILARKA